MDGYGPATYGDGFADVYDDLYGDGFETGDAVAGIIDLLAAPGVPAGDVLELGVGTGRVAIPLAARLAGDGSDQGSARRVIGLDASAAMLDRLRAKPGSERVKTVLGDMGEPLPAAGLALVAVTFNTFFALTGAGAQARAMSYVAAALAPGGRFVIEAFVPVAPDRRTSAVEVRAIDARRVVLSIHRADPATRLAEGAYVELSETAGVRLRPWSVRWSTPNELDALAGAAGFDLISRHSDWEGTPFDDRSAHHVSVYRRGE